ncbi:hypothetical protein DVQ84_13175 [Yersinia enterocolitica]|nr:hypothetical protein [Yersinia enterocolitica]EKN6070615.1 hypothetical protein [Yersinia enterocolitica]EKN6184568.1 hypothetical protein [Yersinia enterocolitica]EKN6189610.1 hypothetical protein [Yersinia enterocolitica]EKN6219339.1 hypothetical protein [Yersinia enterocolitica]
MCVGYIKSPESLTHVSSSGLMSLIPEAHPAGRIINAVQIGSRPICISLAAFLQLELFRA